MARNRALTIEKVAWSDQARDGLGDTLRDDGEAIEQLVREGRAELWRIDGGASWMVTRIDDRDLVIVCYSGKDAAAIPAWAMNAARRTNLQRIRFHTQRPGLARLLHEFDVHELERVYVINVR